MITKINNVDMKILALFTQGYNKQYYIREVQRIVGVSPRTALVTLARLEKQGILQSETKGKIKLYSLRDTFIAKEYLVLAEQFKTIQFLEQHHIIKEIVQHAFDSAEGMVLIFGSFAKGLQKKGSDLDVFIVGKYDEKLVKKYGNLYKVDINVKQYPLSIFKGGIQSDILVHEVIKNHIILKGAQSFVSSIKEWKD